MIMDRIIKWPDGRDVRFEIAKDITDRKRTEETLRESEEKYRNIIETTNEGVWIFNSVSETTYVNERMAKMLGYSREEIVGSFIWDYADEEDKGVFRVKLANRKQGIDEVYELKLMRKEGSYVWLLVSAKAFFDKDGKFAGSLGMFTDITERKHAEEALKKAHDSLEAKVKERTEELEKAYNLLKKGESSLAEAQKMAHIGNWEWDIATDKAYWSEEMYRIFKRDPQKLAPSLEEYYSYIHPDDLDYYCKVNDYTKKRPTSGLDFRIVLANGEERTLHIKSDFIFDDENNPIRVKGIVQDITENKKAEEKLLESEEKYRNIVETANEGIGVINNEFKLTYVNKKLEDMIGYSTEELIGKSIWLFLSEESKPIVSLIFERRLQDFENPKLKYIRKDGSYFWAQTNAKPIFDNDGKFMSIITMLTDITKQKEAEEYLEKIEIGRKKEIHHRIKNNLQVISSLLDLQASKFRNRKNIKDSEVLNAFRESQNRVVSMAFIHEELYRGGETDTLDFSEYIRELADNLYLIYRLGDADIRLNMDLDESTFFDMDTAVPLGMIVNELVSNSFKYAFTGRSKGEIRIELHRDKDGENRSGDYKSVNFTLTVSDNGIGMPENLDIKNLDSLGLQIVTSLVDQLDGELELRRNNGTEFTMKFSVIYKDNLTQVGLK